MKTLNSLRGILSIRIVDRLAPAVAAAVVAVVAVVAGGCRDREGAPASAPAVTHVTRSATADARALILASHAGDGRIDEQIRRAQEQVRTGHQPAVTLERLGWLFVGKARESFDPGYYTLAEHCALTLDAVQPGAHEGLLLRGHALHSQHRFQEAEPLALRLVAGRGLACDYGLLGDILADVGRVDEAVAAYQSMLDLKPDPQGYARAAHMRWLKGDLEGAIAIMHRAVAGVSPREKESAAWMHTQLGRYLWQAGQSEAAGRAVEFALEFQAGFPPALLLRGRMLLATGQPLPAAESLAQAAALHPLPEYHWALAEACEAAERVRDAGVHAEAVVARGRVADPRTCSLFLATRRQQPLLAVRLARQELRERADVLTHDALAWALSAAGEHGEARHHLEKALAHGTRDARLALHAGIILGLSGATDESRRWLDEAKAARAQLLPSEQGRLDEALAAAAVASAPATATQPPQISSAAVSGPVQEP